MYSHHAPICNHILSLYFPLPYVYENKLGHHCACRCPSNWWHQAICWQRASYIGEYAVYVPYLGFRIYLLTSWRLSKQPTRSLENMRRSQCFEDTQIAKFMGPSWGPPGSCRPQMGPILVPWTLQSGYWYVIFFTLWLSMTSFADQRLLKWAPRLL